MDVERDVLWFILGAILVGGALLLYRHRDDIYHRRAGWGILSSFLGWTFIVLGLLGGLLPLFPGVILGIPGLILVGPNDPLLRRLWKWVHDRAVKLSQHQNSRLRASAEHFLGIEQRLSDKIYTEGQKPPWAPSVPESACSGDQSDVRLKAGAGPEA